MSEPLINISRKQAFYFSAAFVFFEFLTYVSNDMIMPGMIQVVETFHASLEKVGSSLSAYVLGGASLQLFLGPLSDNIGRRPIMIMGVILFLIFTILLGCSQSMSQFLIGRFVQGMGLCFIMIGYASIQELFEEMDAVRLIALLANTATIAPLLGPLIGASVLLHFNWRYIYLIVSICALLSLYALWKFMPETIAVKRHHGGTIERTPFKLNIILGNYLSLLKNHAFMLGAIALGVLYIPCLAWVGLSPVILISNAKLSVIQYALWQIPLFAACILGNFFLRYLTHRRNLTQIIAYGSALGILGLLLMGVLPWLLGKHYLLLIPGLTLYGFGLGITSGPCNRHLLFITPISKGTTNALISMLQLAIMGVGTELANLCYQSQNNLYFGEYAAVCALIYFILMYAAVRMPQWHR